jgi:DUF971 family protein
MGWETCQMPGCNSTTDGEGDGMCSVCRETQPQKMAKASDKAFAFLQDQVYLIQVEEVGKAQMSDVRIGFEDDPKREIQRLKHMGVSEEEAMRMYQQYLDSLEHGG